MALAAPADSFGERLAQARRFAGIDMADMAERIGVSRRTLYSWERNKTTPRVDQLLDWAATTGFDVDFFLSDLPGCGSGDAVTSRSTGAAAPLAELAA